jgi:hypothetical protein
LNGKLDEWVEEDVACVEDETFDFDDLFRRSLRDEVELCDYYEIRWPFEDFRFEMELKSWVSQIFLSIL